MKSFVISILLATSALAAPSISSARSMIKRQAGCDQAQQPSADQVATAIRDWLSDVQTVNSFLDNAMTIPDAAATQAPNVLKFAQNEPVNLMILMGICGVTDEYTNAVNDLSTVFVQVLDNLQNIIDGGDLQTAVNNINQVRCCNVLPDLDVLWLEAAESEGLIGQVQTTVPREMACSRVTC